MVERRKLTASLADSTITVEDEPEEKRGPGAPPKYKPEYAKIAKILCEHGATDPELADAFDCSTTAIQNWMSKHPEFGEAVRFGKAAVFDPKVERALAQRAVGYAVDCEEVKVTKDGGIIRYPIRKHFAPDVTACIFWLKNRNPKAWRDVQSHDHKFDWTGKSSQELLEEIQREAAELGIELPSLEQPLGIKPNGKGSTTLN